MFILKAINWCLCLGLRCTAYVCGRTHERLKSGPSARLWAASDHELMAEAKRRGLLKRSKTMVLRPIQAPVQAPDPFEPSFWLAVQSVRKLQLVPQADAEQAVRQALAEIPKPQRGEIQEVVKLAIRKCA